MTYDGDTYYYVTNLQGDVVAILDSAGSKVVSYTYDAWGNILDIDEDTSATIGEYNPLLYRGYVYDQETGLYYLQSRYYNPQWGRFISADSVDYLGADGTLLSYNLFAYCQNNPVMNVDPLGNFAISLALTLIVGTVVGAIIGGGVDLGMQLLDNGGNIDDVDWGSV